MNDQHSRFRLFIHVCPKSDLNKSYWLNAVIGLEPSALGCEYLARDLIQQVISKQPEEVFQEVSNLYKGLSGIDFVDPDHFIIELYVTPTLLKVAYVSRDLNFVPQRRQTEPVIDLLEFHDIPLATMGAAGKTIINALRQGRKLIRRNKFYSVIDTVCYTYVVTHLLYTLMNYILSDDKSALYVAAIIPTIVIISTIMTLISHFRHIQTNTMKKIKTVIPLNIVHK